MLFANPHPEPVVPLLAVVRLPLLRLLQAVGVVAGDVAELRRPQRRVHRMGQQRVDQLLALVAARIVKEGAHLLGRGKRADRVQIDAAEELRVARQVRRDHVQPLQPPEHQAVDVVGLGDLRVGEARLRLVGDEDANGHDVAAVGDDEGGVAGAVRLDPAQVRDLGDGVVVGAVLAQMGDVLAGVVRERGEDLELGGLAGLLDDDLGRGDADGRHVARAGGAPRALGDPCAEHAVLPGGLAEPRQPAVLHLAGGLQQQQAAVGPGQVDSPSLAVANQGRVVLAGVVAEQRQLQPALALEGTVAGAGRAPHAAEQAHDVALEINVFDASALRERDGGGGEGRDRQGGGQGQNDPRAGEVYTHSANLRMVRPSVRQAGGNGPANLAGGAGGR